MTRQQALGLLNALSAVVYYDLEGNLNEEAATRHNWSGWFRVWFATLRQL